MTHLEQTLKLLFDERGRLVIDTQYGRDERGEFKVHEIRLTLNRKGKKPTSNFFSPETNSVDLPDAPGGGYITYLVFDAKTGELLKPGKAQKSTAKDGRWGEYGRVYINNETAAWKGQDWEDRELIILFVYQPTKQAALEKEKEWREAIDQRGDILMPWDYRGRTGSFTGMKGRLPREFDGAADNPSLADQQPGFANWYKEFGLQPPPRP